VKSFLCNLEEIGENVANLIVITREQRPILGNKKINRTFTPVVGPSGGTLLNSKIMCKRVHVGGVYIDIRKII
jgi:hypothetical protein